MLIAGFQKMTLLDYPGKIAALIFTQGCNFACGYCHNPEMIPRLRILPERPELEPAWILKFLKTRKGLLDGVVISGGEPTLQKDLVAFIEKIKKMGFLVKLDTNGSHPEVLKKLLKKNLLDYIAMDLKAALAGYPGLVKNKCEKAIQTSIRLIMKSGIDYEFRSTILPRCHKKSDIKAMGKMIQGATQWYLQSFRPIKTLDRSFQKEQPFSNKELYELQEIAASFATRVGVRT
jgi:pyruvate formate lyase activating enzyme